MLILDDNATSRNSLVDLTRSWGMIADCAPGGNEALIAMRARTTDAQSYDVIIVDDQMPGMDGPTLARTIRIYLGLARIPLIMLGTIKKSITSAKVGADDCDRWLSKPMSPSHLYLALCVLLAPRPANLQRKVFHCEWPASIGAATTAGKGAAPDARRILVVDDNAVNRRVAKKQGLSG